MHGISGTQPVLDSVTILAPGSRLNIASVVHYPKMIQRTGTIGIVCASEALRALVSVCRDPTRCISTVGTWSSHHACCLIFLLIVHSYPYPLFIVFQFLISGFTFFPLSEKEEGKLRGREREGCCYKKAVAFIVRMHVTFFGHWPSSERQGMTQGYPATKLWPTSALERHCITIRSASQVASSHHASPLTQCSLTFHSQVQKVHSRDHL